MGRSKKNRKCPRCNSSDVLLQDSFEEGIDLYVCADCDHEFEVGGSISRNKTSGFDFEDDLDSDAFEEELGY
ncbi:MAG: hypothetical protein ABII79_13265 [bacterium]